MGAMMKIACSCVVGVTVATRLARRHSLDPDTASTPAIVVEREESSDLGRAGKKRNFIRNMRVAEEVVQEDLAKDLKADRADEMEQDAFLQRHFEFVAREDAANARAPETQRARFAERVQTEMAVVARVLHRGDVDVHTMTFAQEQNLAALLDKLRKFASTADGCDTTIEEMDKNFYDVAVEPVQSAPIPSRKPEKHFQDLLKLFAAQKGLANFQLPTKEGDSLYYNVVRALSSSPQSVSYKASDFLGEFFLYASLKPAFQGYVADIVPGFTGFRNINLPAIKDLSFI